MNRELAAVIPLIPDLPFDDLEGTRRVVDELVRSRPVAATVGWSSTKAALSWRYYLGGDVDVPPLHAAPARTSDLSGLPPARGPGAVSDRDVKGRERL